MLRTTSLTICLLGCGGTELGWTEQQEGRECGSLCGNNSGTIDGHKIHDANEQGLVNDAGFWLTKFEKDGFELDLDVIAGRLHGTSRELRIEGDELRGAKITLKRELGETYEIVIEDVGTAAYWVDPSLSLETYLLRWNVAGATAAIGQWPTVCPKLDDPNEDAEIEMFHSVLFDDDRIDSHGLTVYAVEKGWFNIGCKGHALAKMALMGHTEAAKRDGFVTTLDERQALLKMFAADYCGNGTSFTVDGQPLDWHDDKGWIDLADPDSALEARWTSAGASCLDEPRRSVDDPEIETAISKSCERPPPCRDPNVYSFEGAHMVSALLH